MGDYYERIVHALEGLTDELQEIPKDRLDWAGAGAVLELHDRTAGSYRKDLFLTPMFNR